MNDNLIRTSKTGKTITKVVGNYDTNLEMNVSLDEGMYKEYIRQLGSGSWVAGGQRVFKTEEKMIAFAEYFTERRYERSVSLATDKQVRYMIDLGIVIPENCSIERASQLIDAAKRRELGSVSGFYRDGSN